MAERSAIRYEGLANAPAKWFANSVVPLCAKRCNGSVKAQRGCLSRSGSDLAGAFGAAGTLRFYLVQPNGEIQIAVSGQPGQNISIQASVDLQNWTTITNIALTGSDAQVFDPGAPGFPQRFYRASSP